MLKLLNKREKLFVYLTTGVIAAALVFNLFIAPIFKKSEVIDEQIRFARAKLKKYALLLKQKEILSARYNKLSAGHKFFDDTGDTSVTSLAALENLAKDANVRIIDIRPQSSERQDVRKVDQIDLRTEGSIESYLKFLYNIENSFSLFEVKRFQLNSKPNSALLEGSFTVSQLTIKE